jgi:hypothetical protein
MTYAALISAKTALVDNMFGFFNRRALLEALSKARADMHQENRQMLASGELRETLLSIADRVAQKASRPPQGSRRAARGRQLNGG